MACYNLYGEVDMPEIEWRAKRMREAAEAAELSSEQIGKRLHKTGALVRRWWNGTRTPGIDDLEDYAIITRHPVEYFLREEAVLHRDFTVQDQMEKLQDQIAQLADKVAEPKATYTAIPPTVLRAINKAQTRTGKIELAFEYVRSDKSVKFGSSVMKKLPIEAKLSIVRMYEDFKHVRLLPEDLL